MTTLSNSHHGYFYQAVYGCDNLSCHALSQDHSRLQSFARPPPRITKGDEQVIRHTDRQSPWIASLPAAKKRSYLINCKLSITHVVVYPRKNTYFIIHTNLEHFQMVFEVELCIWLFQSIWWPSSRCTNFVLHSARLQLRSKRKIEINSDSGLWISVKFKFSQKSTLHTTTSHLLLFMTSSNVIGI